MKTLDFEKIIAAAHTRITRGKGKGKDYAPSVYEIQDVIDNEIARIDKENGQIEFVTMEKAVSKLQDVYSSNVLELLKTGVQLQNNFAYYQLLKSIHESS